MKYRGWLLAIGGLVNASIAGPVVGTFVLVSGALIVWTLEDIFETVTRNASPRVVNVTTQAQSAYQLKRETVDKMRKYAERYGD